MGVDKVVLGAKGVYLVRFATMEKRDVVLKLNRPFFDSKPVVLKPWTQDMDFTKEDLRSIPIWVKLHRLGFMYWGERSLSKIVGKLGVLKRVDNATAKRYKLQFARVQVEVLVEQEFPEVLRFVNEKGVMVEIDVEYEWKPLVCTVCKTMGHDATKCRKGGSRRVWVPRQQVAPFISNVMVPKNGGFQTVLHSSRRRDQRPPSIPIVNHFPVLDTDDTTVEDDATVEDAGGEDQLAGCEVGGGENLQNIVSRRGDSPGHNG
ncbi:uncharacterized protein [Spinacia oleracea]|uniref:DUF4283 domain-containing protein n=1 Tax=Spinacia oleracea TaxID=3562 RepID=A0A9R0I6L5_SPIOL|nr:uncharacterized protein LOC110783437 [Spinacia oleracea]